MNGRGWIDRGICRRRDVHKRKKDTLPYSSTSPSPSPSSSSLYSLFSPDMVFSLFFPLHTALDKATYCEECITDSLTKRHTGTSKS